MDERNGAFLVPQEGGGVIRDEYLKTGKLQGGRSIKVGAETNKTTRESLIKEEKKSAKISGTRNAVCIPSIGNRGGLK